MYYDRDIMITRTAAAMIICPLCLCKYSNTVKSVKYSELANYVCQSVSSRFPPLWGMWLMWGECSAARAVAPWWMDGGAFMSIVLVLSGPLSVAPSQEQATSSRPQSQPRQTSHALSISAWYNTLTHANAYGAPSGTDLVSHAERVRCCNRYS